MTTSEKSRAADWKDKYFKAVNEFDEQERGWSDHIARLSRDLVGLLGQFRGIDATFDRALESVDTAEVIQDDAVQTRLNALVDAVDKLAQAQVTASAAEDGPPAPISPISPHLLELIDRLEPPPRLDACIDDMRNSLRAADMTADDAAGIELLAAELSAMLAMEDANRLSEARDSIQTLIDHLSLPESAHARLAEITPKLQSANDAETLRQIAKELGDFIVTYVSSLQAEIEGLNGFLHGIKDRLGEVSGHMGSQESERAEAAAARDELDKTVRASLGDLRLNMEDASDLEQLKTDIHTQLAMIDGNLSTFISSESDRARHAERKSRALIGAIKELALESEQLRDKLQAARQRAVRDPLTGLPNRLAYEERMRSEYARFERQGSKLSVVVIDIDKFKSINDTYGHQAGDRVLKHLARELHSQIRKQGFFGRFGGEEFVLILPDTARDGALELADALRRHMESCRFKHKDSPVNVTISCGIAEFRSDETIDTVFGRADAGLYAAKNNGRNRCEAVDNA